MSILFDDTHKDFDPTKLTEEQAATYRAFKAKADPEFMASLKKAQEIVTGDGVNGTFRIEVVYEYRRSAQKRCVALINVYRSNRERTLDMDQPLFFCSMSPDDDSEVDQTLGCGSVLTGDELMATLEGGSIAKVLWCGTCNRYINRMVLCSSLFMNNEPKIVAERVYKLFRELNSDADIVLTHHKGNMKKAQEDLKGNSLTNIRAQRERALYPLRNIIKDVNSGGSIARKIEDFLSI